MSLMSLGVFWLQLPLFLGNLSSVMSSGVNLGPAVKNRTTRYKPKNQPEKWMEMAISNHFLCKDLESSTIYK